MNEEKDWGWTSASDKTKAFLKDWGWTSASDKTKAFLTGFKDGRKYDMSEPNEPRFEDDFDVDTDPQEPNHGYQTTLEDIAIEKGHEYARKECDGSPAHAIKNINLYGELKEAYKAGFLEGFSYRLTQPNTGEDDK